MQQATDNQVELKLVRASGGANAKPESAGERHMGWTYVPCYPQIIPTVYNREVFCNYVKILPPSWFGFQRIQTICRALSFLFFFLRHCGYKLMRKLYPITWN